MKDLSKKLKEAGFPQPDFEFGQKWLHHNEIILILYCTEKKLVYYGENNIDVTSDSLYDVFDIKTRMCFIPSFQDLWYQLPQDMVLADGFRVKKYITLTLQDENLCYVDYIEDDNDVEYYNQYDTNITEASAKLWILLKEKNLI